MDHLRADAARLVDGRQADPGTLSVGPVGPVGPSSPSATATTPASTTITFCPKVTHRICKRHLATASCRDTIENLLQRWLIRISDQAAPKVLLQRLMCARSAFRQHAMGVLRDVFELHTGHGPTLALWRHFASTCGAMVRGSCSRTHRYTASPRPSADAQIVDVDRGPRLNAGAAQVNSVTPLFQRTPMSPHLACATQVTNLVVGWCWFWFEWCVPPPVGALAGRPRARWDSGRGSVRRAGQRCCA